MGLDDLPEPARLAIEEGTKLMLADKSGNIHRVSWGYKFTGRQRTNIRGVVFSVKKKGDCRKLGSPFIPGIIDARPSSGTAWIHYTDVQEAPQAEAELLRLMGGGARERDALVQESGPHQQCHNTPIPGGVEIQPVAKQWLGTLGCKVVYKTTAGGLRHGATTNWHVATGRIGQQLVQPGGPGEWFAKVARSPGVKFDGSPNYVDLAILDIERVDGAYAPRTHTVHPKQVTLGAYLKEVSTGGLGTKLARDGRTLGRVVDGEVTGIGASVRVGYGADGTALFVDQIEARHPSGQFSAPGDSGSMVFEWPTMKPYGKLFAGGGGVTIISPAKYMLNPGGVHSFE